MSAELVEFFERVQWLAGVLIVIGLLGVFAVLNLVFRMLVSRFGTPPDDHPHRTGTELPRVLK